MRRTRKRRDARRISNGCYKSKAMALEQEKIEIIIEVLKKGNIDDVLKQLEGLSKGTAASGASLDDLAKKAKNAFAALGGIALVRRSINEFLESEKAVSK